MPTIAIERIVSVSSEDPAHPASNLLKIDYSNKKWKGKTGGEKSQSVVLQLKKAAKISAIDVGNENSAFVEVLVGKAAEPDDLKPLLVTSSLMSLQEAKNGDNINGVKFFKHDSFSESVKNDAWDRVKLVCSQPYNKFAQYGLSFVVFHTEEEEEDKSPGFGRFQLKVEKNEQPILQAGGLFAQRKDPTLTGAAAIRAANQDVNAIKLPTLGNRKIITVTPSDDLPQTQSPKDEPTRKPKKQRTPKAKKDSPSTTNKRVVRAKAFKKRPEKDFNKFFENVVFAISGFQNPLRGEIRSKGIAMGGRYKPDWDPSCTHLICAFANTPKYNQVRGNGKIVKKEWVEESHRKRVAFPWRRYALDPNDISQPESDEEVYELVEMPPRVDNRKKVHSESDNTEDEIEKVMESRKPKRKRESKDDAVAGPSGVATASKGIYDMDTEDEEAPEEPPSDLRLPPLNPFFENSHFLLLDNIDVEERKKLTRYIIAHKGIVTTDKMDLNDVEFAVSEDSEAVALVKEQYPVVIGVKPEWIWRCHDENRILPLSTLEI